MSIQKIWTVNCIQIVVFSFFLSFFLYILLSRSFFIHSFSLCQSAPSVQYNLCRTRFSCSHSRIDLTGFNNGTRGAIYAPYLLSQYSQNHKMYRVLRSFSYQLLQAPLFSRLLVLYIVQENQKLNERIIYRMNKIII